ncbi:regulator of chromosome condensation 1/beta-lactamase-inhibitor protein II [Hypoxylon argillaceum]|nr:regulator of chromosome condensation 1/beta-lactamase-inhibitor protein II [Hypoxylon argillaceum]KAI1145537.1 regulator of chromosome condensation 1/beta-lactamase-inhibitor protein II [Nemania diffusa]
MALPTRKANIVLDTIPMATSSHSRQHLFKFEAFPRLPKSLAITVLAGGNHHWVAVTAGGEAFAWGRIDAGQLGVAFTPEQIQDESHIRCDDRGKPRTCLRPTTVPIMEDVAHVACGTDHTLFITKAGAAYSSGFGFSGQLGLASNDDVNVATLITSK